jgi:two-component system, OmpR family, copper resistance phosphate regulon response regulator CusR
MRILLVEDERKTVNYLRKGLSENGFVVDVARDGDEGLSLARPGNHDLIILDVMLPGCDGWTVLKRLRAARNHVPVLFLTARDSVDDRVRGLEAGADDYLIKPFAFSELLARIRTILRRGESRDPVILEVADATLDFIHQKATRGGKPLELTPKEFALLALLMRKSGEVLSRAVIADQVWGMKFDGETNVVDVHVRRLRAKVDDPFERKLIHTIRGVGYVLEERQ